MKPIMFNNKKIDASLFLQMENLMYALLKRDGAALEYAFQAYYDERQNKVANSHFWDDRSQEDKVLGLKSEIYLKALGNGHFSDMKVYREYTKELLLESPLQRLLTQVFVLIEDLRLEEIIKKKRPGTLSIFARRREVYRNHFRGQYETNRIRHFEADMLFSLIYIMLTNDKYESFDNEYMDIIEPILFDVFEARSTEDVMYIVEKIRYRLESELKGDMINHYFGIAPLVNENEKVSCPSPVHELDNDDKQDVDEEKKNAEDETFSTWHRENENNDEENFLQFELEHGTKTSLDVQTAREEENGDQAMGMVYGNSRKSKQNNFDNNDEKDRRASQAAAGPGEKYGKYNIGAEITYKAARTSTPSEKATYSTIKSFVHKEVKELQKVIEKTMENKKNAKTDKYYGRLRKKWLRVFTEKQPRMFYKKGQESKELDVAFHLLVDCSGSMFNKMDETKKSVVLFHEALKSLGIPHAINGFWEDASSAKEEYKPNVLHEVITYETSLNHHAGAEIMQLTEEEDNRDGFIIRLASEALAKRPEKHKFLLLFTDGEPSALDYQQDGILDTHEAVKYARKKGMEVIGIFIEEGEENEETYNLMKNIYDHHFLVAKDATDLRLKIKPLLKKLLLKSIQ
ncbi:vWA domain-containing protein [Priestia taiwanensis]|uniref:VWA domain-containing protein n=1 Tax=Priestia taiwanensis TaxID=1347902 RepID=A0A917EMB5_9BACI|nr:VWA domain-containing protein [Priestia taiwanensis]MBM7361623.1 nitric oxide reductase activation protein [Priestia taiwanensis]GGE55603.1 VWA domain-containing protein [Priestia taiwanensis]